MNMKIVAGLAFFLNTVLFATYYALAKGALARIDPLMFTFFEMTTLAPIGLCILAFTWRTITTSLLKRGILLGSSLCLALFTIAIALGRGTATGTAFFPALNGFLAALFAWVVMRQPIRKATWCAGVLSLIGAVLLMINASMGGMRGSLLAFLGGLFFTGYVFLADTQPSNAPWPLFGIELLTMATWASLIALLFGNWQAVHPELPKDALVILYVAGACTFLPTLITITMQKYISVVTISFIYILEPILSAGIAMLYLHEMLPLQGYIGGGLVVAGAVIHTWGTTQRSNYKHGLPHPSRSMKASIAIPLWSTAGYQLLCVAAIACILYGLGGFPPSSWRLVYTLGSKLLPLWEQGQNVFVALLVAQAACWLCAWVLLISVGCRALFRAVQVLFIESADAHMKEGWNERSVL
jgi:drug/metabolite transporter (DMT)-like permease